MTLNPNYIGSKRVDWMIQTIEDSLGVKLNQNDVNSAFI
jgi:hypothetical protein